MSGYLPHDKRGFFMLPQAPQEAGYYVYGTPDKGRAQYADPRMITLILAVEREWQATGETRKFGVGNISKAEGVYSGHGTHKDGLQVDVRPLRKDGRQEPVWDTWPQYDKEGTQKLIEVLWRCFPGQITVLFDDSRIPGVKHWIKHDDHMHIAFK